MKRHACLGKQGLLQDAGEKHTLINNMCAIANRRRIPLVP
jgi:hypothetical protein